MDELQLTETAEPRTAVEDTGIDSVIEADDLIEEVSIDGMCGVY